MKGTNLIEGNKMFIRLNGLNMCKCGIWEKLQSGKCWSCRNKEYEESLK